jgi:hypothetical protein
MLKVFYSFLLFLFLHAGCREIYLPDTDFIDNVLVVNGLLTDQPGSQHIQLSLSTKNGYTPLLGASVSVRDDENQLILFNENTWVGQGGSYYSPPSFAAEPGRTYTLHIVTQDGKEYESDPQTLLSPLTLDSLYGTKVLKDYFLPTSTGGLIKKTMEGLEIFGDFSNATDEQPRLRLDVSLLLLYAYNLSGNSDITFYCWKKLNMVEILNINNPRFDVGRDRIRQHNICFLPERKSDYSLADNEYFHKFILIIRQYRLNNESYEFYKGIREQLEAEGKLFDPLPAQLKGNIRCVSHPGELTLGLFEVSATQSETFRLNTFLSPSKEHYSFTRITDLESISGNDCMMDIPPYFWNY